MTDRMPTGSNRDSIVLSDEHLRRIMYEPWFRNCQFSGPSADRGESPVALAAGDLALRSGCLTVESKSGRSAEISTWTGDAKVSLIAESDHGWVPVEERRRQLIESRVRLRAQPQPQPLSGTVVADRPAEILAIALQSDSGEVSSWTLEDEIDARSFYSTNFEFGDSAALRELRLLTERPETGEALLHQLDGSDGLTLFDHPDVSAAFMRVSSDRHFPEVPWSFENTSRIRVWSGRDDRDNVTAVVLDLQPVDRHESRREDRAPWLREVDGWARFSSTVDDARFDLGATAPWAWPILQFNPDKEIPRSVVQPLGTTPLRGELFAGEPLLPPSKYSVPLGIEVAAGLYPTFALYSEEIGMRSAMLVLQLASGIPRTWTTAPGVRGRTNDVVAETGQMNIWCEHTPESLFHIDISPPRAAWDGGGGGIVGSGTAFGDGGVGVHVGLDWTGAPVLLVLDSAGLLVIPEDRDDYDSMSSRYKVK